MGLLNDLNSNERKYMTALLRLFFTLIGALIGVGLVFALAFLMSNVYDFDLAKWNQDSYLYLKGMMKQYWFIVAIWFLLMLVVWNKGVIQFFITAFAVFTCVLSGYSFMPIYEKEISMLFDKSAAEGQVTAISYQCGEKGCDTESIKLGTDTFISLAENDDFKKLFIGDKISITKQGSSDVYVTNNALLVRQFNQMREQLNQVLYAEKLKEIQDHKTETSIKLH